MVVAIAGAFLAGAATAIPIADPGAQGATPPVVAIPVATRDLPAGHVITGDDIASRSVPVGSVLGNAAFDPLGRSVSSPIFAGELVTDSRLAGNGRLGLTEGEVAVGIVPPLAPVPVTVGDVVALHAVVADPIGGAAAEPLGRARVVAVDDRAVTVAVTTALAPRVLEAQAVGSIELSITP
ncbi:MAG: SAF domain-containing protein [Acidimicrobiales bacterium]